MKRNGCAFRLAALMFAGSLIVTAAQAQLTLITLHSFAGPPDGVAPFANLIPDAAGNLYGTTTRGGSNNLGTVFKLMPNPNGSYSEAVLYSFTGGTDGSTPYAALIADAAGNLYGATTGDNGTGNGNVLMLSPSVTTPWPITVLHSFSGPDGERPLAAPVADAAGNLYGTAFAGGTGGGNVFMLTRSATAPWPITVLYNFTGGTDGASPIAPLIFDATGNLYGTTPSKGAGGNGTVFMLTRSTATPWPLTVLYSFAGGADGAVPNGLIADASRNLYSTTVGGGTGCGVSGCGTVFKLTRTAKAPWPKTLLYSFTGGADGGTPESGLVPDSAGNFYGTTTGGGYQGGGGISPSGVVYKLTPAANAPWPQSVLYTFLGQQDGGDPYGGLLIDTSGAVYGTTVGGGISNNGTVFKLFSQSTATTCTDNSGVTVQLGGRQFVPCPTGQVGTSACPSLAATIGPGLPNCGTETCIAQNTWSNPEFSMCAPPPTCTDNGQTFPVGATETENCTNGVPATQIRKCIAANTWTDWNTSACQCPTGQLLCFNGLTQKKQCVIPLGPIIDNQGVSHSWCGHLDPSEEIDCSSSCPAGPTSCAPAFDNRNHIQTTDEYCGDGSIGPKSGGGSDSLS